MLHLKFLLFVVLNVKQYRILIVAIYFDQQTEL